MNAGYAYAIVIPVAFFIAGWCFCDTTCHRGKCTIHAKPEDSKSDTDVDTDVDTKEEEKLEEDIP